jgi:hypothetical protein
MERNEGEVVSLLYFSPSLLSSSYYLSPSFLSLIFTASLPPSSQSSSLLRREVVRMTERKEGER